MLKLRLFAIAFVGLVVAADLESSADSSDSKSGSSASAEGGSSDDSSLEEEVEKRGKLQYGAPQMKEQEQMFYRMLGDREPNMAEMMLMQQLLKPEEAKRKIAPTRAEALKGTKGGDISGYGSNERAMLRNSDQRKEVAESLGINFIDWQIIANEFTAEPKLLGPCVNRCINRQVKTPQQFAVWEAVNTLRTSTEFAVYMMGRLRNNAVIRWGPYTYELTRLGEVALKNVETYYMFCFPKCAWEGEQSLNPEPKPIPMEYS